MENFLLVEKVRLQIDAILGRNGEPGKLKALREQKAPLRAKREELKRKADAHKPEIAELRRQLDSKVNLIAVIFIAV